jgi:hypothetical protein
MFGKQKSELQWAEEIADLKAQLYAERIERNSAISAVMDTNRDLRSQNQELHDRLLTILNPQAAAQVVESRIAEATAKQPQPDDEPAPGTTADLVGTVRLPGDPIPEE